MGTDDLFHKRKKAQQRKKGNRKQYSRILIVCEGSKTEPFYFEKFCSHCFKRELKRRMIEIKACPSGNTPVKIVEYAKLRQEEFEKIYCVFDKDEHSTYKEALEKCNNNDIIAITSVPCFEYWLLLHYKLSTKPFKRTGKYSPGQLAKKELKKWIKNYKEGNNNIFEITKKDLNLALKNAEIVETECRNTKTDNPSTKVYQLVEDLMELAKLANKLIIN